MKFYLNSPNLGEEIKSAMSQRDITQMLLAKRIGVTQGQISNVVKGKFKTRNNLVLRICKYLKINCNKFHTTNSDNAVSIPPEIEASLVRLCSHSKGAKKTVLKILSLLENLS